MFTELFKIALNVVLKFMLGWFSIGEALAFRKTVKKFSATKRNGKIK